MIKLIMKNLWARRKRNVWLVLELILVTIVSWVIFDPIIVMMHDKQLALGYEMDGLYEIQIATLKPGAKGYDESEDEPSKKVEHINRLTDKLCSHPDVQCATPLISDCYPNSDGTITSVVTALGDSLNTLQILVYRFIPNTSFFETYGFGGGKQYDEMAFVTNEVIVTENVVGYLKENSTLSITDKYMNAGDSTMMYQIKGTVNVFKHHSSNRYVPVMFYADNALENYVANNIAFLFRLKKDVNQKLFAEEFSTWIQKNMRSGNFYARSPKSARQRELQSDTQLGVISTYWLNTGLAIFFLVNLCLGVIGTFWLQTKSRKQEIGIMLSYGATPRNILQLLLGEGVVLTTLSTLIGCLVYLQYALKEGLYRNDGNLFDGIEHYWVTDFTLHYIGVSLIVYCILLVVVSIGIYIPGHKISSINPTEALRDE